MNSKLPVISIAVGVGLIGGSLLLKYLTRNYGNLPPYKEYLENGEAYLEGLEDHKTSNENILNDVYIESNKPDINELISRYSGDIDGDDIEEVDEENEWDNDEEEIDEEIKASGPFIISVDSFQNEYESFSKNTLTYFEKDGVIADDRDEVIVDYLEYIGDDALDSFGEGSDDPNIVYVRNLSKEADYEIVKDPTAYQETVLGYDDPDKASKYFNLDYDREE